MQTQQREWPFRAEQQRTKERHVLVGESARMRHVKNLIAKVSRAAWPVLLLGETGVGKEVIARAIHAGPSEGPFVTIDCSALVGPLVESELFGHTKGAFTGAQSAKTGLIEMADGGTAFFDEIGELPLEMQAKLLRVLQEKEYRPVGSTQTRRSNFRVIAATNRDLAKEVERGTFRQDLYYRLNVLPIRIPTLRDRREDIPVLINHFRCREGLHTEISAETMDALLSYEWPGNVRELENCIHHMVAMHSDEFVEVHDLPTAVQNHAMQRREQQRQMLANKSVPAPLAFSIAAAAGAPGIMTAAGVESRLAASGPSRMPMAVASDVRSVLPLVEVERCAIMQALEHTGGDRNVAAHLLGIGRTTLYRKLKEYRLEAV